MRLCTAICLTISWQFKGFIKCVIFKKKYIFYFIRPSILSFSNRVMVKSYIIIHALSLRSQRPYTNYLVMAIISMKKRASWIAFSKHCINSFNIIINIKNFEDKKVLVPHKLPHAYNFFSTFTHRNIQMTNSLN